MRGSHDPSTHHLSILTPQSSPIASHHQPKIITQTNDSVAAYNVAQLSALRAHVASRALGLLPATSAACASFRSSNEVRKEKRDLVLDFGL